MITPLTTEEREYVLGRLDRAHIDELASEITDVLVTGSAVEACYMPGDGTWYALLFAPLDWLVGAAGGGTKGYPPSRWWRGQVFVAYGQRGTFTDFLPVDDPEYVASRLTDNHASCLAIAELIRAVQEQRK